MEKLHLPAGYDTVLKEFAKKNNVAFETAFYNLMDFIQLKDYSFHSVKVLVENPDSYLEEGTEIEEKIRSVRKFMDIIRGKMHFLRSR